MSHLRHSEFTVITTNKADAPIKPNAMPKHAPIPKANVDIKPMSIDKLINSYKTNDEEEEELLPGFRYLQKMKNEMKREHVKRVFKH